MENPLPVRYWGEDPLYWIHVKLFARDVLQLKNYPGFKEVYAISNHPIERVEVTGYIVEVDEKEKLIRYGVDDGTAFLPCCMWKNEKNTGDKANIGDLVTVMGKITTFRGEREVTLSTLHIEADANAEVFHWMEVIKLRKKYETPFQFPDFEALKARTAMTKPWLKNELEIEIDVLEESLKTEIRDHMETRNMLSFSIVNVSHVKKVKEIVKQILTKKAQRRGGNEDEQRRTCTSGFFVEQVLKQALTELERDGVIYCVNYVYQFYELITVKDELSPHILHVIKAMCKSQDDPSYDIAESRIMANLKSSEKYKYVPEDKVALAMEHLVTKGSIYETREGHYRIV